MVAVYLLEGWLFVTLTISFGVIAVLYILYALLIYEHQRQDNLKRISGQNDALPRIRKNQTFKGNMGVASIFFFIIFVVQIAAENYFFGAWNLFIVFVFCAVTYNYKEKAYEMRYERAPYLLKCVLCTGIVCDRCCYRLGCARRNHSCCRGVPLLQRWNYYGRNLISLLDYGKAYIN